MASFMEDILSYNVTARMKKTYLSGIVGSISESIFVIVPAEKHESSLSNPRSGRARGKYR
jgi:hypothetical protein